jgi:Dolichyl-phosphate-mannose-protein mannosyltransferase
MSVSTVQNASSVGKTKPRPYPRWQTMLLWGIILGLVIIAIGMRLYQLGLPFDRDSYDEGVYWQSLRAMGAGYPLYQQIFYSQPPFFLLSTFPTYIVFGGTLWSARLGIALVSLFGLLGALLLGKALSSRVGAVAALLLLIVDPLYLAQSQTIQAEVSAVAFSLLAVGCAYVWWEHPEGLWWAALTGITFTLSILCKLLTIATILPIALLLLARLWQIHQKRPATSAASLRAILVGIGACLVTLLVVMLPFLGSLSTVTQSMISFHTDAGTKLGATQQGNMAVIQPVLTSFLALTALYGTASALVRRDWRVLPLLAWLLGTLYVLWHQVPLFTHHLVALTPPLIALAVMGIGKENQGARLIVPRGPLGTDLSDLGRNEGAMNRAPTHGSTLSSSRGPTSTGGVPALVKYMHWIALLLILVTVGLDVRQDRQYYRTAAARSVDGLEQREARVASDLRTAITPGQWVVTDAQFVAALAHRNTPPSLVDTSAVRIDTGYLTVQQLIAVTSGPQVHAVLFFSGRFSLPNVAAFHTWVAQHFHLLHNYGGGQELWVR